MLMNKHDTKESRKLKAENRKDKELRFEVREYFRDLPNTYNSLPAQPVTPFLKSNFLYQGAWNV